MARWSVRFGQLAEAGLSRAYAIPDEAGAIRNYLAFSFARNPDRFGVPWPSYPGRHFRVAVFQARGVLRVFYEIEGDVVTVWHIAERPAHHA